MRLVAVHKSIVGNQVRLSGQVQVAAAAVPVELFFDFPLTAAALVSDQADAFVPVLLLAAMAAGEDLEIQPPVSARICANLELLQQIHQAWYPSVFHPIQTRLVARAEAGRVPAGCGAFFSLGVDSFHTLLRQDRMPQSQPISHLIHMLGFEVPLHAYHDGRETEILQAVNRVAQHRHKQLVCGRTNLRDCFRVRWGKHYFGAALAATGLALGGGLGAVLVPADVPWDYMTPTPNHPSINPLWSTATLSLSCDGTAPRTQKLLESVLPHPAALRELRVCSARRGRPGNCGICPKCLRTMIPLEIVGALRDCGVFPPRLPARFWRRLRIDNYPELFFARENLCLARQRQAPAGLIRGLERAIRVGQVELVRRQLGTGALLAALPDWAVQKTWGQLLRHRDRRQQRAGRLPP